MALTFQKHLTSAISIFHSDRTFASGRIVALNNILLLFTTTSFYTSKKSGHVARSSFNDSGKDLPVNTRVPFETHWM